MSDPFADMDARVLADIGDDLTYCPGGGSPIEPPFRGWVAYTNVDVGFDGYTASVDEPSLQVRVADVPVPTKADLITLPKTGKIYRPKDWNLMPNGEFWAIPLKLA